MSTISPISPIVRKIKRAKARSLPNGEAAAEKEFIAYMKEKQFEPSKSQAFKLLRQIFGNKCNTEITYRFCRCISEKINVKYPREAYRRKKTSLFWIEENIDLVKSYINECGVNSVRQQMIDGHQAFQQQTLGQQMIDGHQALQQQTLGQQKIDGHQTLQQETTYIDQATQQQQIIDMTTGTPQENMDYFNEFIDVSDTEFLPESDIIL